MTDFITLQRLKAYELKKTFLAKYLIEHIFRPLGSNVDELAIYPNSGLHLMP